MMRKKKEKEDAVPSVILTPDSITLMQVALALFELPLQQADHRDANVALAQETFEQVKSKLTALKQSVGLPPLIGFDYNEKIILTSALRLCCMSLLSTPQDAQGAEQIRECLRLVALFESNNSVKPTQGCD